MKLTGTFATDILEGAATNDLLRGEGGDDELYGYEGKDSLLGGDGDDYLVGDAGDDTLRGGNGFDFLRGGQGNDILDGGTGQEPSAPDGWGEFDRIDYRLEGGDSGVTINLATGKATDTFGGTDTLVDIEGARGSEHADTLIGGNIANDGFELFTGFEGNDTIDGGSGRDAVDYYTEASNGGTMGVVVNFATGTARDAFGDTDTLQNIEWARGTFFSDELRGSGADDRFDPYFGNDYVNGGLGSDTVSYGGDIYRGGTIGIVADLAGNYVIDTGESVDQLVSIENVYGSGFDDTILGDAGANILDGDSGDDVLKGRDGDDQLYGGYYTGADVMFGGAGNDVLWGGRGSDLMRGGSGGDLYVLTRDGDEDIIRGFVKGSDAIDVSDFGFTSASQVTSKVTVVSSTTAYLTLDEDTIVHFQFTNTSGGLLGAGDILL